MPIFEFKCESCGYIFDDIVKAHVEIVKCEKCKNPAHKTINSYLSVAHGLPNGFYANKGGR